MMTGNLSFQIEHHLYPDMPSTRYKEISPRIQDLFERYDLPYVTGSLPKQVASAWHKVFRLALPNNAFGRFNRAPEWVKEPTAAREVAEVRGTTPSDGRLTHHQAAIVPGACALVRTLSGSSAPRPCSESRAIRCRASRATGWRTDRRDLRRAPDGEAETAVSASSGRVVTGLGHEFRCCCYGVRARGRESSRWSACRSGSARSTPSTTSASPSRPDGSPASSGRTAPARPRRCGCSSAWPRPDAGTATIGGRAYSARTQPARHVGAALEASSFHPGRTARDHLRVYAPQVGVGDARCDEVLGIVGLGRGRRPAHGRVLDGHAPAAGPGHDAARATRRCSCSTSRRTAWTRRGSPGCASSCATWPRRAARCWSPATCSPRSSRPSTTS